MEIQIIIPVYKPNDTFLCLLDKIKNQTLKNIPVLIIDSGSDRKYESVINTMNCNVINIDARNFNHGKTRQMGVEKFPDKDVYIFLTQDVVLADEFAIENLVKIFRNENIGCAYGRQLPHKNAGVFGSFARLFNYKNKSYIRSIEDKNKYGMKTVFISNSFAAYRYNALKEIGGFPDNTILSEDMYVAAKMLLCNWKIAYCADAKVYHSHDYSILQEFKRYFDIGVFHAREAWIREIFGTAEGEGKNFVKAEVRYLLNRNPVLIIPMIVRDGMKFIGYRLGLREKDLNIAIKKRISMNTKYWNKL